MIQLLTRLVMYFNAAFLVWGKRNVERVFPPELYLTLPSYGRIYAGPWRKRPRNYVGICLAREMVTVDNVPDYLVDWPDFGLPRGPRSDLDDVINMTLMHLRRGDNVYVGCAGGSGRTGTFLALLTKISGVTHDPVGYVRRHYKKTAVETAEQMRYVDEMEVRRYFT